MYHKLSIEAALETLDVDAAKGLSRKEVAQRHAENGANTLSGGKRRSVFRSVLAQLNEPMIYILFAAAAISAVVGEWIDSLVILAIVVINAVIGVVQEQRAEKALDALKRLTVTHALVRREGKISEIAADELSVGDIVILEAGRVVPADLRLIFSADLAIDESALTGESVPVTKDASVVSPGDIPLGDRVNSAYQGTVVCGGRGEGVVTATGMSTEVGQIADMLNSEEEVKTPLQLRLAKLGKLLGAAALIVCAVFFVIGLIRKLNVIELLLTAVSLAVAVIPEGLTAVVTIVLALGVTKMVSKNAIVRKLPAVETLGSVNVICTDKTGTLTQNKMTVVAAFCDGAISKAAEATAAPMLDGFALCNDAVIGGEVDLGDPTETALLKFSAAAGIDIDALKDKFPRLHEISFDSTRKMMTTLHRAGDTTISYTKGALDSVLPLSSHIWDNGSIRSITNEDVARIERTAEEFSARALRVLALAMRTGDRLPKEESLVFIGFVGMIDPPREEARLAVSECLRAGIRVVMITGDHKATALAIGSAVGISDDENAVLTGAELDKLSDEELFSRVEDIRIFARVDPKHKIRIVKALRAHGHVVSMTGDGVNDAPSLKAADIGVAMGLSGTDAAKDASDLILTDDNFATIASAVEQGRGIFENIKKTVAFLLSSNTGELIAVFLAMVLGWASPLLPLHILWINLITDSLPALALGVNPISHDIMSEPPRSAKEGIFTKSGWLRVGGYGFAIGVITLAVFKITEVITGSLETARTAAFVCLSVSQLFHSMGIRAGARSFFKIDHFENKFMLLSVAAGFLLTLAVLYIPFIAGVFDVVAISPIILLCVFGASILPLIIHELEVLFIRISKKESK